MVKPLQTSLLVTLSRTLSLEKGGWRWPVEGSVSWILPVALALLFLLPPSSSSLLLLLVLT